jgi:hypothetical protein
MGLDVDDEHTIGYMESNMIKCEGLVLTGFVMPQLQLFPFAFEFSPGMSLLCGLYLPHRKDRTTFFAEN